MQLQAFKNIMKTTKMLIVFSNNRVNFVTDKTYFYYASTPPFNRRISSVVTDSYDASVIFVVFWAMNAFASHSFISVCNAMKVAMTKL